MKKYIKLTVGLALLIFATIAIIHSVIIIDNNVKVSQVLYIILAVTGAYLFVSGFNEIIDGK